jgi:hypothetical protein
MGNPKLIIVVKDFCRKIITIATNSQTANNLKRLRFLPHLQTSKLVWCNFIDVSKRHKTPWLDTKGRLLFTAITIARITVFEVHLQALIPTGQHEEG